jgi:hypothetical protein
VKCSSIILSIEKSYITTINYYRIIKENIGVIMIHHRPNLLPVQEINSVIDWAESEVWQGAALAGAGKERRLKNNKKTPISRK